MARKIILPTEEEDKRINRGIAADPDTYEWTDQIFARAKPEKKVSANLHQSTVKRQIRERSPQKSPVKKNGRP